MRPPTHLSTAALVTLSRRDARQWRVLIRHQDGDHMPERRRRVLRVLSRVPGRVTVR
jgi:hypothetical protein